MSDTGKSAAMLLDELASLDPQEGRVAAATLRRVSATFAEVSDVRHTAQTLGLLAHFLDPTDGR